ncbi:MAG TPA: UTP--glucose-1-phosphate uridylyltransferase [Geopsychrobacteraceae bacterium]|nr:UTP--glucose-1-phosphate uridylyltransferase [Geopsychrobacteraceae bacterium]
MIQESGFAPFAEKMAEEGLPEDVIRTFAHSYTQLVSGNTGMIPESEICPVETLPDAETLLEKYRDKGEKKLPQTVLLKLNGGLGTGMGLEKAKSLLNVKDGLSFLDIIARQALAANIPLILMNSFSTREDSLAALQAYPELKGRIPLDFLQHKVPKIRQDDFSPVECPANAELEWNPPGHGDIYTALMSSGLLNQLLGKGYRYAFVSNADNLGAVVDTSILGYLAETEAPFLLEVADRTEADRKGGHLARSPDGQLVLRESAQCAAEDEVSFQDISRHRYFNTNSLWLNLERLKALLEEKQGVLGLPPIFNRKTVDPRNPESTPVIQIETAMGSAISVIKNAAAIRVPRSRFAPVKTTDDLLAVRSDIYLLNDNYCVVPNSKRTLGAPVVHLDGRYYKLIDDFEARFPEGAPSLLNCSRIEVVGDVLFGGNVVCSGEVFLENDSSEQKFIERSARLGN